MRFAARLVRERQWHKSQKKCGRRMVEGPIVAMRVGVLDLEELDSPVGDHGEVIKFPGAACKIPQQIRGVAANYRSNVTFRASSSLLELG